MYANNSRENFNNTNDVNSKYSHNNNIKSLGSSQEQLKLNPHCSSLPYLYLFISSTPAQSFFAFMFSFLLIAIASFFFFWQFPSYLVLEFCVCFLNQ